MDYKTDVPTSRRRLLVRSKARQDHSYQHRNASSLQCYGSWLWSNTGKQEPRALDSEGILHAKHFAARGAIKSWGQIHVRSARKRQLHQGGLSGAMGSHSWGCKRGSSGFTSMHPPLRPIFDGSWLPPWVQQLMAPFQTFAAHKAPGPDSTAPSKEALYYFLAQDPSMGLDIVTTVPNTRGMGPEREVSEICLA